MTMKSSSKSIVNSKKTLPLKQSKTTKNLIKIKSSKQLISIDPILGQKVSSLILPMTGEQVFKLKQFQGFKIVLYFYPKDMTPGCTIENRDFNERLGEFKKLNCKVVGISRDSLARHEKFKEKEKYKVDLASDEDETACKLFDVIKEKNMYGKKVLGIERSTFIIDEQGKVIMSWRKVKVEGHVEEVIHWLKLN